MARPYPNPDTCGTEIWYSPEATFSRRNVPSDWIGAGSGGEPNIIIPEPAGVRATVIGRVVDVWPSTRTRPESDTGGMIVSPTLSTSLPATSTATVADNIE